MCDYFTFLPSHPLCVCVCCYTAGKQLKNTSYITHEALQLVDSTIISLCRALTHTHTHRTISYQNNLYFHFLTDVLWIKSTDASFTIKVNSQLAVAMNEDVDEHIWYAIWFSSVKTFVCVSHTHSAASRLSKYINNNYYFVLCTVCVCELLM